MKICEFETCDRSGKTLRGLCPMHYKRLMRGTLGRPEGAPRYRTPRTNVGKSLEWPFEFEKRGDTWFRRPTGSDEPWELVPGFKTAGSTGGADG